MQFFLYNFYLYCKLYTKPTAALCISSINVSSKIHSSCSLPSNDTVVDVIKHRGRYRSLGSMWKLSRLKSESRPSPVALNKSDRSLDIENMNKALPNKLKCSAAVSKFARCRKSSSAGLQSSGKRNEFYRGFFILLRSPIQPQIVLWTSGKL